MRKQKQNQIKLVKSKRNAAPKPRTRRSKTALPYEAVDANGVPAWFSTLANAM